MVETQEQEAVREFLQIVRADKEARTIAEQAETLYRRYYLAKHVGMELDSKEYLVQPHKALEVDFKERCIELWVGFEHPGKALVGRNETVQLAWDSRPTIHSYECHDMSRAARPGDKTWLRWRMTELSARIEAL